MSTIVHVSSDITIKDALGNSYVIYPNTKVKNITDFPAFTNLDNKCLRVSNGILEFSQISYNDLADVPSSFIPVSHSTTHLINGTDPISPSGIGASIQPIVTPVTFTTAGWVLNGTTGYYEQTVACANLLTTDGHKADTHLIGDASSATTQENLLKAYQMVDYWACNTNGQLYARSPKGKPTVDFSIDVVIIR